MINTYEPPLLESVLLQGSLRPVVVGVVFSSDIISPHGGVVESLTGMSTKSWKFGRGVLPMWALARGIEATTAVRRRFRMSQIE